MVYITRGLLSVLLERGEEADPASVSLLLDTTPAGQFPDLAPEARTNLDPDTPVLTHFYLPETGSSVSAVFGMNLSTPAGRARFLTHPDGGTSLRETDDLAGAVLIAVPPYDERSVVAYDRRGRGLDLTVIDADPPEEELETLED